MILHLVQRSISHYLVEVWSGIKKIQQIVTKRKLLNLFHF